MTYRAFRIWANELRTAGAVVTAAILATLACSAPPEPDAKPAFAVESDRLSLRSSLQTVRFTTEAARLGAPLSPPPVSGRVTTIDTLTTRALAPLNGRLVEVRARAGDRVTKGDKLLRVQTSELASLRRDSSASDLAVKTKRALLERLQQLHALRGASDTDLLQAQSELADAKLRGDAATTVLRSLALVPADTTSYWLVAPRSGTVVSINTAVGAEVGPGSVEPPLVVSDLSEVLVVATLPARDVPGLDLGVTPRVGESGTGRVVSGKLEAISEIVDAETQTVAARIRVGNRERTLRPNAYVEVSFQPGAATEVLTVPSEAVVSDGATSVVFVESQPGRLEKRVVSHGRQGRERTEITQGLQAGERVVTTGALLILNALDVKG